MLRHEGSQPRPILRQVRHIPRIRPVRPIAHGRSPTGPERFDSARASALVVGAYTLVIAVALTIGAIRGNVDIFVCTPLRPIPGPYWAPHALSLALGLALAAVVVAATRTLVRTRAWAAALHEDLRPAARALGSDSVVIVALASAVGEEALFRGALVPWLGPILSSALFGLVHQLPGRSRLSWFLFATVVGGLLATLFLLTGSLVGPLTAHLLINTFNLRFLIGHDPRRAATLGGLLQTEGSHEPRHASRADPTRSFGPRVLSDVSDVRGASLSVRSPRVLGVFRRIGSVRRAAR